MKTPKRIWMGIAALAAVLVFGVLRSPLALALGPSDFSGASYSFNDGANIQASISGSQNVLFTDQDVSDNIGPDSGASYKGDPRNFIPAANSGFCDPGTITGKGGVKGDIPYGIDVDPSANLINTGHNDTATFTAQIKLGFGLAGSNGRCSNPASPTLLESISITSAGGAAGQFYQWNNDEIVNQNNSNQVTFIQSAQSGSGSSLFYLNPSNDVCKASAAIKLNSAGANQGTFFQLEAAQYNAGAGAYKSTTDWSNYPNLRDALADYTKCDVVTGTASGTGDTVLISGKVGVAAVGYVNNEPVSNGEDACVAKSGSGLDWLLCPITSSLETATDTINKTVDKQLNFDINQNLTSQDQLHLAWSIIKDIASALVVILLLVMVISQAFGGGPFEAYTIRKMLPKLVVAVIAMQLSWDICIYFIKLANDAGQGIGNIMALPFGANDLSLNNLLNHLSPGWAAGSQAILPVVFIGGIIIGSVALPATFVMLFGIFVGVFAALMVLLFRNVLIVALTLFAPLAFLAWTMSGTQNLWKTWKENFYKLLMMFPLLIAIIYTGRIFAWIVANGGGSHGFIDYLTVLVAFFGPYFVIFKAYKWGGSLLSAAGSGIANARKGIVNANSGWLKTLGERAQGNIADRYTQAREKERQTFEQVGRTNDRISNLQKRIDERKKQGHSTDAAERRLARLQGLRDQQSQESIEAQKRNGRLHRAVWRVGAGKPIWFSDRQKLETLARGGAYKKELVEQKQALIHDDYVSQLNATGSVSLAKEYIRDKYGFGNMKRDAQGKFTGAAIDKYTERAFWNWVVDTKSAMELGNKNWRTDNGSKIDLAKTKGFLGMMNSDPNRYGYVASNLPELQPFNQAIGGGPKAADYEVGARQFRELERTDAAAAQIIRDGSLPGATAAQIKAAEDMKTMKADDARYRKIFQNLEHTSDIASWRPEQLQIMADNIQKMKLAGASSSAAEAEFSKIMRELARSNTPEARSTLQRLAGGERSARKSVNEIMGDRWLEDSLDLPVETTEGVARFTALPRTEAELEENYLRVSPDGKPTKIRLEVARGLAEGDDYLDQAHGGDRIDLDVNFDQLRDKVARGNNTQLIQHVNGTLDEAIAFTRDRANRLIKQASQEGHLTPTQLKLTEDRIAEAARQRVAELQAKKIDVSGLSADPTTLIVPHPAPTPSPTAIREEIRQNVALNLPAPATLVVGSPAAEAFEMQLRSDPQTAQALAKAIAFGQADPAYITLLTEMRNKAAVGTPQDQRAYNNLVERIQQALQARINETAAAAAARGHDPALARTAAAGKLAPQIIDLEPGGGLGFKKI